MKAIITRERGAEVPNGSIDRSGASGVGRGATPQRCRATSSGSTRAVLPGWQPAGIARMALGFDRKRMPHGPM